LNSITATASTTGSVIALDEIAASSLTEMTLTAVSGATVDLAEDIDITTIGTITMSGAGTINMDDVSNQITTLEQINASGTSGTVAINLVTVTNAATVSLGTGSNTITAGLGGDTINLASSGGTDQVNMNTGSTTAGTILKIDNFQVGASADDIALSLAGMKSAGATTNYNDLDDGTTDLAAADVMAFFSSTFSTGAVDMDNAATDANILNISSSTAFTTTTMETALEAAGAHAFTASSAFAVGDSILVLYDDNTNSYLGEYEFATAAIANNGTIVSGNGTFTNLVEFTGLTDCTTLVAGNFDALVA
jgi:hypothetical protein